MLDRSVASAAAPVLVFPHNIEIGRACKGGKGGGKSCWVSVVFIFLACARPPGGPKTCTDRCGQKGTSGKLTHLSQKSLCPCAEKWARNQAQKMGSFFERPPRPARLGLTYFEIIVTSRVLPRFIQSTSRYEVRHVRDGGAPAARAQAVADASAIRAERPGAGGWLWVGIGGGWGLPVWGRNGVWVRTQQTALGPAQIAADRPRFQKKISQISCPKSGLDFMPGFRRS